MKDNDIDDHAIENLSDDKSESESNCDTSDEDDEKQQRSSVTDKRSTKNIDYNVVKEQLNRMKFRGKIHLPFIEKSFHFHGYGFENTQDCKILFKATKQLIEKYATTKDKAIKRHVQQKQDHKVCNDVEGFVHDTQNFK